MYVMNYAPFKKKYKFRIQTLQWNTYIKMWKTSLDFHNGTYSINDQNTDSDGLKTYSDSTYFTLSQCKSNDYLKETTLTMSLSLVCKK
jgi:hypothetical protein